MMIILAHDALGSADEIIPAVLAGILLVGVIIQIILDGRKKRDKS